MDNENELNLELDNIESNVENNLKVKNRFEKLSEKVILTSKERDEAIAKANAETTARTQAEKDRDFYKDFSGNVSKYPQATEYQDKILEKVRGGYSTEDAVVAVLAKEGKLTSEQPKPLTFNGQVEGGSAPTTMDGNKSMNDMKPDEKLAALTELDKSGALANALRGR